MSIADKLQTIAENEQRLFDAGKEAEQNTFWDTFQDYGKRDGYSQCFFSLYWNDTLYNPKYPLTLTTQTVSMFNGTGVTDTKVDIIVRNNQSSHLFAQARQIKTIRKIVLEVDTPFPYWFYNTVLLENITFEGTIYQNIDFGSSPLLTYESLINIINCLKDYSTDTSGTTYTCTLGTRNLAKLSDTEKAMATEKGWTLA